MSDAKTPILEELAADGAVQTASTADAVDGIAPRFVAAPADAAELAVLLARADEAGLTVAPRGGGTKLGWGNPPRAADLVLSTHRLDAVVEHVAGDLTVTVQAGCTLERLQRTLAEHGQRLALDPLFPARATVGGMLATGDSGTLHGAFGPPRDQVIGITVALPDGTLARSGGRVVKNVAGYDLPKLFTGSFGTLGVITEATFRLYPLPHEVRTLEFAFADPERAARFLRSVHGSTLAATGIQLRARSDCPATVAVRLEGFAVPSVLARRGRLQELATAEGATAPDEMSDEVWSRRESLYTPAPDAVIARFSFLPTELATLLARVGERLEDADGWELVAQAAGVGELRFAWANSERLAAAARELGDEFRRRRGSFAIRLAPGSLKKSVDPWGGVGTALPLMQRVKQRFDPRGTLNPGRFVGGI